VLKSQHPSSHLHCTRCYLVDISTAGRVVQNLSKCVSETDIKDTVLYIYM